MTKPVNQKLGRMVSLGLSYAFLFFMVIIILFPLLVTIMNAFNMSNSMASLRLIPEQFSFTHNFKTLFSTTAYLNWYINTFYIATTSMALATTLVTISGFIYSRFRFKTRKSALISLMVIQMVPATGGLIALYAMASSLGIYSSPNSAQLTYIFLILIYVTGGTTMNTIIMKGYYDSIPRDLDESAQIDGATHFQIFKDILLPLVTPMIVVLGVFCFLAPVGDVVMPRFLLASLHSRDNTLALGLNALVNDFRNSNPNIFAAGALLAAIPPVLLFYRFQRYIVGGLMAGGVKG
jgi:arabinogalactan oligomer/maltooligosaccharide transport system permease protein